VEVWHWEYKQRRWLWVDGILCGGKQPGGEKRIFSFNFFEASSDRVSPLGDRRVLSAVCSGKVVIDDSTVVHDVLSCILAAK
jgi:hypothetical protein